jgi:uncharacterized protein YijF (DUF1287 family)
MKNRFCRLILCASIVAVVFGAACKNIHSDSGTKSLETTTPEISVVAEPGSFRADSLPAGLPDKGIWPELDPKVGLNLPDWIDIKQTAIVVDKVHRVLTLTLGRQPLVSYPIALGFAPDGHKEKQGDGKTPEGRYFLCEMLHKDLAARYGARSMRLSYPSSKDAETGVRTGLISEREKTAIEKAIQARKMPPQKTVLGSSIRIHGGGVGKDWTLGCIAMRDPDVIDLYSVVKQGTEIRVLGKGDTRPYGDRDADGIPDTIDLLLGAKKAAMNGADYDGKYVKIPASGGDVPREIGVCTDVVIRALRNAGLDLQVELQRDRAKTPVLYPNMKAPDPSIDHRRVKNLKVWFPRHWRSLPTDDFSTYLPGDVILMDTLYYEGPDHIGIISDRRGPSGKPLVINNWTVGYETSEMDLLDAVPVLGHFRWVDQN